MADTADLKSAARMGVRVQIPPPAPKGADTIGCAGNHCLYERLFAGTNMC